MSDWYEDVLHHKYDPLPEEPRHRKKARKKPRVRSDHRHEYEEVCIDAHGFRYVRGEKIPTYFIGKRCKLCGRLQDVKWLIDLREPPEDMPMYEVKDILDLFEMKALPDEMRRR